MNNITYQIKSFHTVTDRWALEKINDLFSGMGQEILNFHKLTKEKPTKCVVTISPQLANAVSIFDSDNETRVILDTPVYLKIDWTINDAEDFNKILTIS